MEAERPLSQYMYRGNDDSDQSADNLLPIHDAVSKLDIAKVRSWSESGGDLRAEAFKQDRLERTALHLLPYATDDGGRFESQLRIDFATDSTLAIARILIGAMGPDALGVPDYRGRTALHYAAVAGDCSMLRLFASELNRQKAEEATERGEGKKTGEGREMSKVLQSANPNGSARGRTPLHLAALICCTEAVRILIDDFGADAAAKDDDGRTPLHVLFAERVQDRTHNLFRRGRGGDTNQEESGHIRQRYGALVATARLLLDRMGDRINEKDMIGKTPLHIAAEAWGATSDFLKTVFLCKLSLPVALNDTDAAIINGSSDTCATGGDNRLLVDVNDQDTSGRTPLHCSIMYRCYPPARALVEDFGADLSIRDSSGNTQLHALAHSALGEDGQSVEEKEERATLARLLINKMDKDTANAVDEFGNTAINIAGRVGAFDLVIEMLGCSPLISPNARDSFGRTVLHYAALKQKMEAARLLIEDFGVDAWVQDGEGRTALHFLIPQYVLSYGDHSLRHTIGDILMMNERDARQLRAVSSIARLMIGNTKKKATTEEARGGENGDGVVAEGLKSERAGPYTQDDQGDTALHLAAQAGAYHIMQVLFEFAPAHDLDCRNAKGRSALHCAASRGDVNCVRLLVDEFGADVAATDDDGNTALHLSGFVSVTRFLIEAGADVTARNTDQQTPVHTACERTSRDSTEKLEVFLGLNIDVNAKDAKGRTPLHYCAMAGLLSSAAVLLIAQKGVLVNAADGKGMTALDHALDASGNNNVHGSRIADMLVRRGGMKGAELPTLP